MNHLYRECAIIAKQRNAQILNFPMSTVKVKKSAIIAFLELLRSIDARDDVVLLRSSDCHAKEALQTYNGDVFDEHLPGHNPIYAAFIDNLTRNFDAAADLLSPRT